jgi:hypothetical protein
MVEDLAQPESLARIVTELQMMIKRLVPIRFGTISLVKEEDSPCKCIISSGKGLSTKFSDNFSATIIAKTLSYFIEDFGKAQGMNFLTQVGKKVASNSHHVLNFCITFRF